jgi:hypothetical protein
MLFRCRSDVLNRNEATHTDTRQRRVFGVNPEGSLGEVSHRLSKECESRFGDCPGGFEGLKSKFRLIRKMPERGRTNSRCAARTLGASYFGHKICDNFALCLPLIGANSLRVNIQRNSGAGVAKEFLHHFDPFSVSMQ